MTGRSVSSIGIVRLNEHTCHRMLSMKLFGDFQNILFDMLIVCDTLTFVSFTPPAQQPDSFGKIKLFAVRPVDLQ